MHWSAVRDTPCSIARSLSVVGERWTLLILREAFQGASRFDEFRSHLGIARNVLASRLEQLVEHGVFERVSYQNRPVRFQYQLTAKGRDLYPVLLALMRWGDAWMAGDAPPPLTLVHQSCGRAVEPTVACPHCGERLDPDNTRGRLPAATLSKRRTQPPATPPR